MRDYKKDFGRTQTIQERGLELEFNAHFRDTIEGFYALIGDKEIRAIIQKHSNPLNSHLEDKQMITLCKESSELKWGSYVDVKGDKRYIVLTYPETTDGVTKKCKIRKTNHKCTFNVNGIDYSYDCLGTNQLLYDGTTYTTDTVVFENDEREAILLPYDEITKQIKYIDTVYYKDYKFKVILKEEHTQEVDGKIQGVIQFVLMRVVWGDTYCNGREIDAILNFARMKDKKLNSKSRQLITRSGETKAGDYITYIYDKDEEGLKEKKTFINITLTERTLEYDIIYCYECMNSFNLWDNEAKQVVTIPCYVDDNYIRLEGDDKTYVTKTGAEYRFACQENEYTSQLLTKVKRIIMKDKAYEVTAFENISLNGVIFFSLIDSHIDQNKDNLELGIADYTDYVTEDESTSTILEIVGEDECIISCEYTFEVYTTNPCVWSILDGDTYIQSYKVDNNKFTIVIKNGYQYVNKKVSLQCDISGTILTKDIKIVGWG